MDNPEASLDSQSTAADEDDAVLQSLERETDELWKQHPIAALVTLTSPIWLAVVMLSGAFILHGMDAVRRLVTVTAASAIVGRFIIWAGMSETAAGFSPLQLAVVILMLDLVWAVVLTWHVGVLFHVPWLGVRLKSAVHEGRLMLRSNRWLKRMTVVGVMMFVTLPISSTGSIGGSLLGRLLGLSRAGTLATVVVGSLIGGAIMLTGAELLAPWFEEAGPMATYVSIGVLVAIGFVVSQRYRRSLDTS